MEKGLIRLCGVLGIFLLTIMPFVIAEENTNPVVNAIQNFFEKITGVTGYQVEEEIPASSPEVTSPETEQTQPENQPISTTETFGEEEVPEGCNRVTTETGMIQMKCEFDRNGFEEFDIKTEIDNCDGRFEMIEGKPSCIRQGNAGFASAQCPTQEELSRIRNNCNGKIESFVDESGCSSVICTNEEFKERYEERIRERYDNELQIRAIECEKNGGKFTLVNNAPECIGLEKEVIRLKEQFEPISQEETKRVGERLERLSDNIDEITQKMEEKNESIFDEARIRLEGVQDKIEEIQAQLSYDSNLTNEERRELLVEVNNVKKTISEITTGIVEGEMPTEENIIEEEFNQYKEYYGGPFGSEEELRQFIDKERSALEIVRGCDKYSEVKSFVPPDPDKRVVLVDLKIMSNGNCEMTIHTAAQGNIVFSVPPGIFLSFRGPEDLLKEEVSCTGGSCTFFRQMMTQSHGTGEDPEGEACMEACIREDCDKGTFECMLENKEECEKRCGMIKEPEASGEEEQCIRDCVGPGVMCRGGEGGEQNPECQECATQCASQYYSGPCLTAEKTEEKKNICTSQCPYCYGEPVMGDSEEGYQCIIDFECKDASREFGDNPGTGPESYEAGHEPGQYSGMPPMTGGAVTESKGFFESIVEWFKNLFGGKKQEISSGNSVDNIATDLGNLNSELDVVGSDLN